MKTEIANLQEEYKHLGELKNECEKERIQIMMRIKELCEHPTFTEPFSDIPDSSVLLVMCKDCRAVKRADEI